MHRRAMLAKIHMAAKDLALDEATYRALLARVTGKESSRDCSEGELDRLLGEFRRLGFRDRARKVAAGESDLARKIRALWLSLYQLGEVRDRTEAALAAFIRSRTGIDAPRWLDARSAERVIQELRGWCARAGYTEPNAEARQGVATMRAHAGLPPRPDAAYTATLIAAQWEVLIRLGVFRVGEQARLDTWLRKHGGVSHPAYLDPKSAARAIETLGRWIRKAKHGAAV